MDRDEIIKGFLICAIFTAEDENLYGSIDHQDCDEMAHEIAGAAADTVLKFVEDNNLTLPDYLEYPASLQSPAFSFGVDIWFSASGSGVSFKDREGDPDVLEKLTEFCRTRLAQIEHAETWFDEETNKFRISIYQRNF
jgi:LmbE family N-acetylglucosaminyl deacetylase